MLSVPPDRWARYWDALSEVNTLDRLHEIRVPTAVIAGELDASTPPSSMRPIAEAIPDASFQIVNEAPHMITLVMPSRIAALLAPAATEVINASAGSEPSQDPAREAPALKRSGALPRNRVT